MSGSWRIAKNPVASLTRKIFEEAGEFSEDHDPAELYDLLDVVHELLHLTDPDGVHEMKHTEKVKRLGRFSNYLEWSPVPNELGNGQEIDTDP